MSDKKHPLDEVFEMDSGVDEFEDDLFDLTIPENPTLDDITKLALNAYKDAMGDMIHMEVKYKARNREVTQRYLEIARDALAKKEDIVLRDRKLDMDENKKGKKEENTGGGMKRADVLKIVKEAGKK